MKNILIISDGIPGHFNQSKGVAALLANRHSSKIKIIDLQFTSYSFRGFITVFSRFLMKLPSPLTAKIISALYSNISSSKLDLIIAAGGKTAPYTAALRILSKVPIIQLGSPRGLHSSLFSALVTVKRYYEDSSNVIASITPSIYSPQVCNKAAQEKELREHLLFLVGGEGIGYSYEEDEWISFSIKKHSKSIQYIKKPLYLYRQHEGHDYGGILNYSLEKVSFRAKRLSKVLEIVNEKLLQNKVDLSKEQTYLKLQFSKSSITSILKSKISFKKKIKLLLILHAPKVTVAIIMIRWKLMVK